MNQMKRQKDGAVFFVVSRDTHMDGEASYHISLIDNPDVRDDVRYTGPAYTYQDEVKFDYVDEYQSINTGEKYTLVPDARVRPGCRNCKGCKCKK